jgi:hypothetical protein
MTSNKPIQRKPGNSAASAELHSKIGDTALINRQAIILVFTYLYPSMHIINTVCRD